ncbi:MAG TPA: ABC transporter substrate-binding protein, partial [Bradyrhizobium sp.]|nr:ABC transporter substrate-binding protein [Bradyrhizobium sp.]
VQEGVMKFALPKVFGAVLVIAAINCGAAVANAAETITMVTTGKGSAQQWPIFIAIEKGYMANSGVTLDLIAAPSTAAAVQQATAGSANIASGGLTDPLLAIDKGAKIAVLRVETQVAPYSLWAKPAIKTIPDLRGKLISIGGAKDITRIYLERTLVPNGVKPDQYDMIFAGTTGARFAAISSGAVDATLLIPPFSFKAKSIGLSHLADVADYTHGLPFTGYATNIAWAGQHKTLLLGFLTAMAKGVDWFNNDANRNEAIDILVKRSGLSAADVGATYDYYRKLHVFDHKGSIESDVVANLIKAMQQMGDFDGPRDISRFIDPDITGLAAQVK